MLQSFPPEAKLPDDAVLYVEHETAADTGRDSRGNVYAASVAYPAADEDQIKFLSFHCKNPFTQVWQRPGVILARTLLKGFQADEDQHKGLNAQIAEWQRSHAMGTTFGALPKPLSIGYGWLAGATLLHDATEALTPDDLPDYSPQTYFALLTSRELHEGDFTLTYRIEDVVVDGQSLIVGGPIKSLKTTIIVALVIALASMKKFLGRFVVNMPSRVLIMSGESGMPVLKETAMRICKAQGIDLASLDNLMWSDELPQLDDPQSVEKLVRTLKRYGIDVLAVDPAYLCFGGSEHGNIVEQGKKFKIINEACKCAGVQLILAHHFTKGAGRDYKPPQLSDLAQSGFDAYARSWVLLKRRSSYKKDGRHELWFDVGGSAGHGDLFDLDINEGRRSDPDGRIWEVEIASHASKHAEQVAQLAEERQAIVKLLEEQAQGLSLNAIHIGTDIPKTRLRAILPAMVADGEIVQGKVKHPQSNKKTIDGFKIAA